MNIVLTPARVSGLILSLAFLTVIVIVSIQPAIGSIQNYTSYFLLGYLVLLGILYSLRKKMAEVFAGYLVGFVIGIVTFGLIFVGTTIANIILR